MSSEQAREWEIFNAKYPDQLDTLQVQIAMIACLFANAFAKKKVGSWGIEDFIPKFGKQEDKKVDIKKDALKLAAAFGNTKTQKWANRKMVDNGMIDKEDLKEYKYPLEAMVKERTKLPARLRMKMKKESKDIKEKS